MTQDQINTYFKKGIGSQCDMLYSTSDERVFIRYGEALLHTMGSLDKNTKPLSDKTIHTWFNPFIYA